MPQNPILIIKASILTLLNHAFLCPPACKEAPRASPRLEDGEDVDVLPQEHQGTLQLLQMLAEGLVWDFWEFQNTRGT